MYQPDLGDGQISKVPLYGAFTVCRRPGCTFVISSKFVKEVRDFWKEDWPHDSFLWCMAIARRSLYSYNEALIRFRRNIDSNITSNEKQRTVRVGLLREELDLAETIVTNYNQIGISEDSLCKIKASIEVYDKRINAILSRNPVKVLGMHKYIDYYPGKEVWIRDLFSCIWG